MVTTRDPPIVGYFKSYDGRSDQTSFAETGTHDLITSSSGFHHPFEVRHTTWEGGLLSGSTAHPVDTFTNYGNTAIRSSGELGVAATHLSHSAASTKLFATINPSRPKLDLTSFIGELKDFPDLFATIGEQYRKRGFFAAVGHGNLQSQFGWNPFVSDLLKLFYFRDEAQKRFDYLKKIASKKGAYRQVKLQDAKFARTIRSSTSHYRCGSVDVEHTTEHHVQTWGYAFIKPSNYGFPSTDRDLWVKAVQTALGLYVKPSMFWDLMPWSWLADWYLDVDTFLHATNNYLDVEYVYPRICMDYTITTTVKPLGAFENGATLSTFKKKQVHRTRRYADAPSISAPLEALNARQWGILGSINATSGPYSPRRRL